MLPVRTVRRLWPVLGLALVLGLSGVASAELGDISVGGMWVFKITKGAEGKTLEQRVAEVEQRITTVLSNADVLRTGRVVVRIHPMGGDRAAIIAGATTILVVTPDDAAGTGVKPMEMARQWGRRLEEGLNKALPNRANPRF